MSRKVSLNNRFILVVIAISVLILLVVAYSQTLVNETAHNSLQTSQNSRQLAEKIRNIKYSIQEIERNIYQYTILSDNSLRFSLIKRKEILNNQIKELNLQWSSINFNHSDKNSNHLLSKLQDRSQLLEQQLDYFLNITASVETKFPGMPMLTEHLLPLNILFIEQVTIAIEESQRFSEGDSPENHNIRTLFENTRYAWAQQISLVRLFVANRLGTFGDPVTSMELNLINRRAYTQIINLNLEQLSKLDNKGLLEIQLSDSLAHMKDIFTRYENDFKKVQVVYLSELWRNDLVLLKNQLQPLFAILWNTINLIENDLNKYSDYSTVLSNQAVNMISIFIWIFTTTILLLLISGYFTFNVIIRKPIQKVASALDSVAKGQHVNQKIKAHAIETDLLVNAFHNMQAQVKSRQNRLESILETAGEGIITIDEHGIIETFNNAAQLIFGYQYNEIIGKNISLLMSKTELINNENFFNIRKKFAVPNLNNNEVTAKRKNGTHFPLLIKMSELVADNKKLYTAIVEDVSERKAMLDNLQKIAEHDSLTELYNRFYFMNELERLTERLKRNNNSSSALFYIDLDNFKYVNDTLGHLAGDQLLIEVSILFKSKLRSVDLIARLGGDEFAVIVYDVTKEMAVKVANILRQNMQNYVFNYKTKSIQIGCSIGIALFDQYIMNKEDLLSRADFACYAAKKAGRNLIHVYTHSDDEKRDILSSDIGWTKRIKNALQNNCFIFIKQPIYDIKNKKITKYEILTRMLDESGEKIIPSVFLPIAERFGLINEIDIWVVKHAIKDLSAIIKKSKNISYSINLSAKSFDNDEIISCITNEIEINNVPASSLIFEITETAAIADVGLTVKFIKKLQKLGCKIALDDFGVGYSSFSYLKNLPIDYVKIDGSFIQDIAKNEVCLTIVKSINDISHALGKKTIAEFAENKTTLKLLSDIGVDYAQGFYIEEFDTLHVSDNTLLSEIL